MGRPPKPEEKPQLNYYGLKELGYGDLPLTGRHATDQLMIESVCFRISHHPQEGGLGRFGHFMKYVDGVWNDPKNNCQKRFTRNSWSDRMLRKACEWDSLGVAGCTSAGKSDPFALWGVANYMMDPTHVKVLVMSTTIKGAKLRIFKTLREYWSSVPDIPGKPLWSTNEVLGPDYQWTGFSTSSGIELLATEKSSEKSALDKLIGVKAPKTGEPDSSFDSLLQEPEFMDLSQGLPLSLIHI